MTAKRFERQVLDLKKLLVEKEDSLNVIRRQFIIELDAVEIALEEARLDQQELMAENDLLKTQVTYWKNKFLTSYKEFSRREVIKRLSESRQQRIYELQCTCLHCNTELVRCISCGKSRCLGCMKGPEGHLECKSMPNSSQEPTARWNPMRKK